MKLGIVTIHNVSNYGAVLQSYALKEVVKEKHDVKIIDFDNRHVSKSLDLLRFNFSIHGLLGFGKDLCRFFPRSRVLKKFNAFLSSNMDIVKFDKQSLSSFDGFISGSDQIWNPACVSASRDFVPEYFLTFAKDNQFKVSYASSCGAYEFDELELSTLKNFLSSYKAIAVREHGTCDMLRSKLGLDVQHVLDPTLLLTKQEWLEKIGDNKFRKGKYILLYVIKKTPLLIQVVKHFKSKTGMKVLLVEQGLHFSAEIDEHIRDAGPEDFISLFNNAEYVITDSFHGTTFSLIFNRPFVTVSPGKNINRIESLLSKLDLQNRIIYSADDISGKDFNFSFDNANKVLDLEILRCKEYLNTNLG